MKNFKKIFGIALLIVSVNLYGLRIGDKAREINGKWKNTQHFQVCYNTIDKRNEKLLKILIFCYPNDDNFKSQLPILDTLGSYENVKVALIADNEQDVTLFLENNPNLAFPISSDRRSSALYMAGSLIYPKAFIINYENKIIWDGELIDVAEVVNNINNGKFNLNDEIKISKKLDQLQSAMRSGDEFKSASLVNEILKIDPINSGALRMRLFMLEEQGRFNEGYTLLQRQKKIAPESGKIYLLMLDLISRYPSLSENLSTLAHEFAETQKTESYDKLTFAWVLLNNFNYNFEAVEGAKKLLDSINAEKENTTVQSYYYTVLAGYFYRIGDVKKAVANQQKSIELLKNSEAERILNYYLKIQK